MNSMCLHKRRSGTALRFVDVLFVQMTLQLCVFVIGNNLLPECKKRL